MCLTKMRELFAVIFWLWEIRAFEQIFGFTAPAGAQTVNCPSGFNKQQVEELR
jgi:hypothetical protein